MTVALLGSSFTVMAAAQQKTFDYLAFGDSISTGYGLSDVSSQAFTNILADNIGYHLNNQAVNGYTAADIYDLIDDGAYDDAIAGAELITLTCGGNDMMETLYILIAEEYNASNDPDIDPSEVLTIFSGQHPTVSATVLFTYATTALNDIATTQAFDQKLNAYVSDLGRVMRYIRSKNAMVPVIVNTQYNPYEVFRFSFFYGILYDEIEAGVVRLNDAIQSNAKSLRYVVADVYGAFKANAPTNLCNANADVILQPELDFHPNAAGHAVIAQTVFSVFEGVNMETHEHTYSEWERIDVFAHEKVCDCGAAVVNIHTYDQGVVAKEATHTEYGELVLTCEICLGTMKQTIQKLPEHNFKDAWQKYDMDQHRRSCECGEIEYAVHSWGEAVTSLHPSDPTKEMISSTCADCGEMRVTENNHIHNYTEIRYDDQYHRWACYCGEQSEAQPHIGGVADCKTPAGCDVCGQYYGNEDATNHIAQTELRDVKQAEEFVPGYTGDTYCVGCDALLLEGEVIPATHIHDYKVYKTLNETLHTIFCECGESMTETHSGGNADCSHYAVCEKCNAAYGALAPDWHNGETELRDVKPAMEFELGYTGDTYCVGCGVMLAQGEVIPATHEHTIDIYTSLDDTRHRISCSCGESETEAHIFDGANACELCDYQKQEQPIAPPEEDIPETPEPPPDQKDTPTKNKYQNAGIYVVASCVAVILATLVVIVIRYKRHTQKYI
ncbi:MAG: hypothetical protein IJW40_10830 [Clostridia bacterium]|nr:hypothetical protein [Clostridia bacterium]